MKVLDDLAANGPAAAAAGTYFEIFINLGADQDGKPVIEHYRKPVAIDVNRSSTDDIDPNVADTGVIAAIEMTKAKSGGDNGGHI